MGANHCGTAAQKQDWEKQETYFFFPSRNCDYVWDIFHFAETRCKLTKQRFPLKQPK